MLTFAVGFDDRPDGRGRFRDKNKMKMKDAWTICINGLVKETEKAVCLACYVNFNANKSIIRNLWFPKSVCEVSKGRTLADVKGWFLEKLERENAFKGWEMSFDRPINA